MDSQTSFKITALQRDLAILEDKEKRLNQELDDVIDQMKHVKKELDSIMKDERITTDILERVYEQRKSAVGDKDKTKSKR